MSSGSIQGRKDSLPAWFDHLVESFSYFKKLSSNSFAHL